MREIILIFGKTGTGKSYYAKSLLSEYSRQVILDPCFEYTEGIIFYNQLDLSIYNFENRPDNFKFICRYDNDLDIEFLFRWCYIVGNVVLLTEEAEQYISPRTQQSDFLRLVRYGRHKDISIIGIARRPTELSIDFRAQVNRIISFKQTDPLDLQRMYELGFTDLENLPDYQYKEIIP